MEDPKPGIERFIWWLIVPLLIAIVSGLVINQLNSKPTPTPTLPPVSRPLSYVVKLVSEQDKAPIVNAKLDLTIEGQIFPRETDLRGQATFQIPVNHVGKLGRLFIEIEGTEIGFIEITLLEEHSPSEVVIDLQKETPEISTATPTTVPSPTPTVAEEPTATIVPSVTPTVVSSPTATSTTPPTSTSTPPSEEKSSDFFIVIVPSGTAVNIYTQASSVTGSPRAQVVKDDILMILETDGNWYRVQIQKNGIEGWIENDPNVVQPFDGTPPVSLAPTATGTITAGGCLTVNVTRNVKSDDIFDDVTLNWVNAPTGTDKLQIWVEGINSSGERAFVVQPTFSDLGSPYTVQQWMFEVGNFTFDSTYNFFVTVLDAAGNQICQTSGTFTQ